MGRLTEKTGPGSYMLISGDGQAEVLKRLGQYEDMHQALLAERKKLIQDLERLKAQGKTNTITYKQLLANKLTVMGLLSRFDTYVDGWEKENEGK